jgi:hypothetical protein
LSPCKGSGSVGAVGVTWTSTTVSVLSGRSIRGSGFRFRYRVGECVCGFNNANCFARQIWLSKIWFLIQFRYRNLTIKSIQLLLKTLKNHKFLWSAKVRHLLYKIRCLLYKISETTGIGRGCTLRVFILKYPACRLQFPAKLLLFCAVRAFACWGWLWLFSISSKQCFCDRKPDFCVQKQKQCTSWMR